MAVLLGARRRADALAAGFGTDGGRFAAGFAASEVLTTGFLMAAALVATVAFFTGTARVAGLATATGAEARRLGGDDFTAGFTAGFTLATLVRGAGSADPGLYCLISFLICRIASSMVLYTASAVILTLALMLFATARALRVELGFRFIVAAITISCNQQVMNKGILRNSRRYLGAGHSLRSFY